VPRLGPGELGAGMLMRPEKQKLDQSKVAKLSTITFGTLPLLYHKCGILAAVATNTVSCEVARRYLVRSEMGQGEALAKSFTTS
jgi:hypothetical protein